MAMGRLRDSAAGFFQCLEIRPGSVSKLFTWTAVMQLVEQGKLDLNKDVNEYLDFKIPEAFGKPITLTNILTHTPGFEEQIKDLFTLNQESPNLGECRLDRCTAFCKASFCQSQRRLPRAPR